MAAWLLNVRKVLPTLISPPQHHLKSR